MIADARIVYARASSTPARNGRCDGHWCDGRGCHDLRPYRIGRRIGARFIAPDLLETMQAVFAPRSVAVVGASTDDLKLGARAVKHLVDFGYAGDCPAAPARAEIYGRQAYPSLASAGRGRAGNRDGGCRGGRRDRRVRGEGVKVAHLYGRVR